MIGSWLIFRQKLFIGRKDISSVEVDFITLDSYIFIVWWKEIQYWFHIHIWITEYISTFIKSASYTHYVSRWWILFLIFYYSLFSFEQFYQFYFQMYTHEKILKAKNFFQNTRGENFRFCFSAIKFFGLILSSIFSKLCSKTFHKLGNLCNFFTKVFVYILVYFCTQSFYRIFYNTYSQGNYESFVDFSTMIILF